MAHRTRLAPSPTGALHLGNAQTFLVNWAMARQQGWRIVLRIEDLDGPRVKHGADRDAMELLAWLGIDWDQGPFYQSHNLAPYQDALRLLAARGLAYPCNCTRSEIEAASRSAPHADEHELCYPGTCRPAELTPISASDVDLDACGWRFRVEPGEQAFVDQFAGEQRIDLSKSVGDFQIWTKGGLPSYQLAVVVDDAGQGIDRIVRGNDLVTSTPRQQQIAAALGVEYSPQFWHLPLVRGEDGKRLAKRHGDTRLAHYRTLGVPAERVIGLLAEWCGIGPREPMTAEELSARFQIERMPAGDVTFLAADDAWLTQTS
ncbi:tRNA glutamyl-Q(34) synthetase GluQRS [Aeoliella sp. SH292]|uniref:tRNA glutamyl-Q(34) synthetase GluQRS n=1 Tax=Aeoliella sp. SH292 TaxID=3454464 RepID=UPI003F9B405F